MNKQNNQELKNLPNWLNVNKIAEISVKQKLFYSNYQENYSCSIKTEI